MATENTRDDDFGMPLDRSIGGKITDEAIDRLSTGGVEQLTLNTLARAACYSPGHFHARVGGRSGMLEELVACFTDRWERRVLRSMGADETIAWLPDTPGAISGARCWHAMVELAHGEARAGRPEAARTIADLHRREQDHLHRVLSARLGRRPTAEEIVVLQMTLHGLRAALAAAAEPVTDEAAVAALARVVEALGAAAEHHSPKSNE